eukprot:668585-Rhodomonas_salina.3
MKPITLSGGEVSSSRCIDGGRGGVSRFPGTTISNSVPHNLPSPVLQYHQPVPNTLCFLWRYPGTLRQQRQYRTRCTARTATRKHCPAIADTGGANIARRSCRRSDGRYLEIPAGWGRPGVGTCQRSRRGC